MEELYREFKRFVEEEEQLLRQRDQRLQQFEEAEDPFGPTGELTPEEDQ